MSHKKDRPTHWVKVAANMLGGEFRVSQRGVPYLILKTEKGWISVSYFGRGNFFRIFSPFPSLDGRQDRWDAQTVYDILPTLIAKGARPVNPLGRYYVQQAEDDARLGD